MVHLKATFPTSTQAYWTAFQTLVCPTEGNNRLVLRLQYMERLIILR